MSSYQILLNLKTSTLKWSASSMVVVSLLPHVEFGQNDHQEDAPHFSFIYFLIQFWFRLSLIKIKPRTDFEWAPISYQFFHFHFYFITNAIVWTLFPPVWRAFNITSIHSEKWYACKITWFSTFQISYETRNLLTHRLHQWFNLTPNDLTLRIIYLVVRS